MYQVLNAHVGMWPQDAIAVGSCIGGVIFLWIGYQLGCLLYREWWKRLLPAVIPASTYLLQVFCGEVEFYAWLNAALLGYLAIGWLVLNRRLSPIWASITLVFATCLHASAIFTFPSLLWLHILWLEQTAKPPVEDAESPNAIEPVRRKTHIRDAAVALAVFAFVAVMHRNRLWWVGPEPIGGLDIDAWARELSRLHLIYPISLAVLVGGFFCCKATTRKRWRSWLFILLPWFVFFTTRSLLGMHPEPLLKHIPPFTTPFDIESFWYPFFSYDHLYDKTCFYLWSAPLGLFVFFGCLWTCGRRSCDIWVKFLLGAGVCAVIWTIFFYPELRRRDWDLFSSMGIPLNLLLVHIIVTRLAGRWRITAIAAVLIVHLSMSVPFVIGNMLLEQGHGYVNLKVTSDLPAEVFVRGLRYGTTPFESAWVRSGPGNLRVVPLSRIVDEKRTTSVQHDIDLPAGETVNLHIDERDLFAHQSEMETDSKTPNNI